MLDSNSLIYINLFFQTWLLRYSIYARVILRYVIAYSDIWVNFQSSFSMASCSHSIVFYSGFYAFIQVSSRISSFLRIRGIFTSLCDFQLVHQFLRNIVIYFLSVEPLFLHIHCYCWSLWSSNACGLPLWLLQLCKHYMEPFSLIVYDLVPTPWWLYNDVDWKMTPGF